MLQYIGSCVIVMRNNYIKNIKFVVDAMKKYHQLTSSYSTMEIDYEDNVEYDIYPEIFQSKNVIKAGEDEISQVLNSILSLYPKGSFFVSIIVWSDSIIDRGIYCIGKEDNELIKFNDINHNFISNYCVGDFEISISYFINLLNSTFRYGMACRDISILEMGKFSTTLSLLNQDNISDIRSVRFNSNKHTRDLSLDVNKLFYIYTENIKLRS